MRPSAPGPARFPLFDACRALAALSVLAYHVGAIGGGNLNGALAPVGRSLSIGVPVFFAISGFLLYRPFAAARDGGRTVDIRRYARRRVLRIVPAYWVALTVLAIAFSWPIFTGDAWRYYGFAQVYSSASFDGGLAVAWTLCIEATFYLLLPLYAIAIARAGLSARGEAAALVGLGALSAVVYAAFYPAPGESTPAVTLLGTFMWFVPGMLLALWTVHRPVVHSGRWWLAAAATFAAIVAVRESAAPGWLADASLTPLFALLLLVPAANLSDRPSVPRAVLSSGLLMWLGTISYGLYLYHATIVAWVQGKGVADSFPSHWIGLAGTALALTIGAAAASWYLIERPALRWRGSIHVPMLRRGALAERLD